MSNIKYKEKDKHTNNHSQDIIQDLIKEIIQIDKEMFEIATNPTFTVIKSENQSKILKLNTKKHLIFFKNIEIISKADKKYLIEKDLIDYDFICYLKKNNSICCLFCVNRRCFCVDFNTNNKICLNCFCNGCGNKKILN